MENYYSVFIEGRTINKFVAEGNLSNQSPPPPHTHTKKKGMQQTEYIITFSEGLFASWSLLEGSTEL